MESAIPRHLAVARTCRSRATTDAEPPYPSFVARHPTSVRRLVMAYLGAQGGGPAPAGAETLPAALAAALADPDGPRHHDRAVPIDPEADRPADVITVGYWDDPAAFERWFARHREPWLAGGGGHGRWLEVIRPRIERYETIFGARSRPEGVAVLAEGFSGPVREHAYWGAMRDRMPAAQNDALHDPGELGVERDGNLVRVRPTGSVCLIRSGQDWSDCGPDERRIYLEKVEPNLRAGMDFLCAHGPEVGCLGNRYLTVLDATGRRTERSYGLGWWRTLADLEQWSASHPTHLAIFGAFTRMVRAQAGRTRLRLYHEVSVAEPDEQLFEYVDCHDRTGLLPATIRTH